MGLFNKSTNDNGTATTGSSSIVPSYNYLSLIPKENQTLKSNPTAVSLKDDKLSFNLMNSIPSGGKLEGYNVSLYTVENATNKLLKAGLSINTSDYDTKGKSNLFLKGNIQYELGGEAYEASINHNIVDGTNIVMDVNTPNPIINSDEEFIRYLLQEIEYLKSRVSSLESGI